MKQERNIGQLDELRQKYFTLNSELVLTYLNRAKLWVEQPGSDGDQASQGPISLKDHVKRLTTRIAEIRSELRELCKQAHCLGTRFKIEEVADEHGLSEIEKDILVVLFMREATRGVSDRETSLTGGELLRLFFREDFEVLDARRLLYPDAPLRRNCLIDIDDYAENVLQSTFRVPEHTVRRLLEHDLDDPEAVLGTI